MNSNKVLIILIQLASLISLGSCSYYSDVTIKTKTFRYDDNVYIPLGYNGYGSRYGLIRFQAHAPGVISMNIETSIPGIITARMETRSDFSACELAHYTGADFISVNDGDGPKSASTSYSTGMICMHVWSLGRGTPYGGAYGRVEYDVSRSECGQCLPNVAATCTMEGSAYSCVNGICARSATPQLECPCLVKSDCGYDRSESCSSSGKRYECLNNLCRVDIIPSNNCGSQSATSSENAAIVPILSSIGVALLIAGVWLFWWCCLRKDHARSNEVIVPKQKINVSSSVEMIGSSEINIEDLPASTTPIKGGFQVITPEPEINIISTPSEELVDVVVSPLKCDLVVREKSEDELGRGVKIGVKMEEIDSGDGKIVEISPESCGERELCVSKEELIRDKEGQSKDHDDASTVDLETDSRKEITTTVNDIQYTHDDIDRLEMRVVDVRESRWSGCCICIGCMLYMIPGICCLVHNHYKKKKIEEMNEEILIGKKALRNVENTSGG